MVESDDEDWWDESKESDESDEEDSEDEDEEWEVEEGNRVEVEVEREDVIEEVVEKEQVKEASEEEAKVVEDYGKLCLATVFKGKKSRQAHSSGQMRRCRTLLGHIRSLPSKEPPAVNKKSAHQVQLSKEDKDERKQSEEAKTRLKRSKGLRSSPPLVKKKKKDPTKKKVKIRKQGEDNSKKRRKKRRKGGSLSSNARVWKT
ncbi:hypothetical protein PIB30_010176 [Stylosanthes scabra]|uniref:Uncharacterized protein n=1 Tax=Stylosanthes scabra TaxID=79078 RepID=A0ABU6R4A7_9FABA|nr:hypothetical protein [Stylosanthes scabra]